MECVLLVDTVASLSQDWKDIYAHVLKDNLLNQINPKIFNFDGTAFKDLNSLNFSSGDLFYSDYKTALSHAQKHSQNIIIISNNRPLEAMQARVSLITRRKGIITQISSTTTDKHIGSILVYLDTATFPADKSHTELLQKLKSQASTQSQLNKIAADDVFYTGLLNWQGNSTATEKECVVHAKRLGMAQFVTDPASLYPATWPLKLCVTSTANANIEAVQKAAQNYNLPVAELVAVQSNIDLKQYGFQGTHAENKGLLDTLVNILTVKQMIAILRFNPSQAKGIVVAPSNGSFFDTSLAILSTLSQAQQPSFNQVMNYQNYMQHH